MFKINVILFMGKNTNLALDVLLQKICIPPSTEGFSV